MSNAPVYTFSSKPVDILGTFGTTYVLLEDNTIHVWGDASTLEIPTKSGENQFVVLTPPKTVLRLVAPWRMG
eukprot:3748557-Rhodomonas_salina.1